MRLPTRCVRSISTSITRPAPGMRSASMVMRSPPVAVQASPIAIPMFACCSDAASWITGQTYPLNGGFSFAL